jgi:RNA polymerase sigma-70 factor (ECF subfamily)
MPEALMDCIAPMSAPLHAIALPRRAVTSRSAHPTDRVRHEPSPPPLEDLLARVAAGDRGAFETVFARTERLVFSVALRIVRNRDDAEDVTAEVFAQVWLRASAYDAARGAVEAWLVMLARSRAVDRLRAAATRQHLAACTLDDVIERDTQDAAPDERARLSELRGHLASALQVLSPCERELVQLAFFEGFTHTELAARLCLPLGTVKTRLRSAMQRLRGRLTT